MINTSADYSTMPAIVTDYLAVIGNYPESDPRNDEREETASLLAGSKILKFITAPGYLDVKDVLRINNRYYIGLSENTNQEGAAQLAFFLKEYGHQVIIVDAKAARASVVANTITRSKKRQAATA